MEDRSQTEADSSNSKQPLKPESGGFQFRSLLPVALRGGVAGLLVGVLASGIALVVVWRCLPFYITYPPSPWPWYCAEPAYPLIGFLAFPVNLLTGDLAQAIPLAPLSLSFYTVVGAMIGLALGWLRLKVIDRSSCS